MTDVQAPLQLADEVGEIYVYAASDLKRVAPLWWEYTKQMRVFHEKYAQVTPSPCFAFCIAHCTSVHNHYKYSLNRFAQHWGDCNNLCAQGATE